MPQIAQKTFQLKEAPKPNGQCQFYIYGYPKGRREVYWFRTAKDAKAEMKNKNAQICAFGVNNTVSGDEIRTIRECVAMLTDIGESSQSIYTAVHEYIARRKAQAKAVTVALMSEKVRLEFCRQLEKGEISKGHAKNIKQSLNGLVREFGERNANEVSCNQLRMDVAEEDWSIHTKNNRLKDWHLAFETAKDLEILAVNPVAGLKGFKDTAAKKDIVILTPEEVTALLSAADPLALPSLVIGAFAGVRRSERLRMDWSMIDLGKARITIPASISKTRQERRIEMMPNLIEWLRPLVKDGKVIEVGEDKHDKLVREAKVATGLVNGEDDFQNALRHSFVTYFYAFTGSLERSLDAAGHDYRTHKKNYRSDKVEKAEAERYWNIMP
jgi:integrase